MPGPIPPLSFEPNVSVKPNELNISSQKISKQVKKLRAISYYPYATDDSSEDESNDKPFGQKRIVREINSPFGMATAQKEVETPSKKKTVTKSVNVTEISSALVKTCTGVRQKRIGRWVAEIRDPFLRKRIWLGTYNSFEDASKAYNAKKLEFKEKMKPVSGNNSKALKAVDSVSTDHSLEDEINDKPFGRKHIVREINFPFGMGTLEKEVETPSKKNKVLKSVNLIGKSSGLVKTCIGVREKRSGRWEAEIRDPFLRKTMWLGTYNSVEEASKVYNAKKLEFQERMKTMSGNNSKALKAVDSVSTDHSLEDESNDKLFGRKRIVREINFPFGMATLEKEVENPIKKKKVLKSVNLIGKSSGIVKTCVGVREKRSGRWGAEIRDPFLRKKIWLGTYNSAEEASKVYNAKKLEFQERKKTVSGNNPKAQTAVDSLSTDFSSMVCQNETLKVVDENLLTTRSQEEFNLEIELGFLADFDRLINDVGDLSDVPFSGFKDLTSNFLDLGFEELAW